MHRIDLASRKRQSRCWHSSSHTVSMYKSAFSTSSLINLDRYWIRVAGFHMKFSWNFHDIFFRSFFGVFKKFYITWTWCTAYTGCIRVPSVLMSIIAFNTNEHFKTSSGIEIFDNHKKSGEQEVKLFDKRSLFKS